jgi:hypothetical protein
MFDVLVMENDRLKVMQRVHLHTLHLVKMFGYPTPSESGWIAYT